MMHVSTVELVGILDRINRQLTEVSRLEVTHFSHGYDLAGRVFDTEDEPRQGL